MKASEDRERSTPERKGAHRDRGGKAASRPARLTPGNAAALQRAAGNRAVSALVAQRPASSVTAATEQAAAAPVEPVPVQRLAGPASDPKFAALKADVRGKQNALAAHKPPTAEASAAQAAAKPPQDDKEAQGKAANAEKMNAAKPGEFDKAAFMKAVNDAIAAQAPKNLDEADTFGDSGKADAVKGQVQGRVADGKKTSAGPIETTTEAPPDLGAAKEKPVTPLAPGQAAATPAAPNPANAIPDKAPPGATDFSAGPAQVDAQMADAQVTEEQLATSNEPEFQGALKDFKAGEQHAATAPGQVRGKEAQTLNAAKAQAGQAGNAAMTGMTGANKAAVAAVTSGKQDAKGSDEAKRAQATAVLQKVFDATKKDVEDILTGLDSKVDDTFSRGEKAARDAFTAEHKRRMDAYKDKRYSGLLGKGRWIKDKFAGLPEEANQIFVTARKGYVDRMQQVISSIADVIGAELGRAKQRIATGRTQLQAEVSKLPKDLQAVGKEAASEFSGKFDELTESVNSKGTELVNTLASKYSEALKAVDAEIEAEKEKNKGLIAKAVDAVGGVIKTILELKDLLLGVLAKAASAVMAIISDPIGFLGKLVSAVGAGLRNFMANIGEHLKKGLIGWLLGAMSGAGLQLPQKFDLKGILGMIAGLLGLTWAAIRGRIVAKGIPEQAMGAVEAGVPLVAKVQSEGVAGLADEVKDQVGDLKENLFGKIAQYLIPTVLVAGITWIISLLNPASAFIKACKMIIDIVTFIIERGAQIIAFVNAVLDAVIAIAGGGTGGVPALIEKALALSIPVLIGALAAILGIGGIADKVKKFFQSLTKPVMKAVDWVVAKIVGVGRRIWAKMKGVLGKARDRVRGGDDSPEGKKQRLDRGIAAGLAALGRYQGRVVGAAMIRPMLAAIRIRYGLAVLEPVRHGAVWAVHGAINPEATKPSGARAEEELTPPLKAALESLTSDEAKKQFQALRERIRSMASLESAIVAKTAGGQRAIPPKTLDDVLSADWRAKNPVTTPPDPALVAAIDRELTELARVEGRIKTYQSAHAGVRGTDRWLGALRSERAALDDQKSGKVATGTDKIGQHARAVRGIDSEVELAEVSRDVVEVAMPVARGKAKSDVDVVTDGGRTWKDAKDYALFGIDSYNWTHHLKRQAERQLDISRDPAYSQGGPPQLVYWFRRGVTPEVAAALEDLGVRVEGDRVPYAPGGTTSAGDQENRT